MSEEKKEVAVVPEVVPKFEISLSESKTRWDDLEVFIKDQMHKDTDYGKIPGTGSKDTLFKSGAEKLMNIFGCYPEFSRQSTVEDHEKGYFFYGYKCVIRNKKTGVIMGEGIGSCNSKEKKNWIANPWAAANTVDKMGQKRALVQAVLISFRLSAKFTQDVEDMDKEVLNDGKPMPPSTSGKELICSACKNAVAPKVADYSAQHHGRILCYPCQQKEKAKGENVGGNGSSQEIVY